MRSASSSSSSASRDGLAVKYCDNRKCRQPVAYSNFAPGQVTRVQCRHCRTWNYVIGKQAPHWA